MSGLQAKQNRESEMDTDSDGELVHQPVRGNEEVGELSDPDQDLTATDTHQAFSEEQ